MPGDAIPDAIPIGIAVVEYGGSYLVGRRGPGGPLPDCDEFPGGKCLPGESPRDCAVRECREEAGVDVVAVELLMHRAYDYPHSRVDLSFWLCRPDRQTAASTVTAPFRWVSAEELARLRFPAANAPLIELLIERGRSHRGREASG